MNDSNSPPIEVSPSRRSFWATCLQWKFALPFLVIVSPVVFLASYHGYLLSEVPVIDHPFDMEAFGALKIPANENACPIHELAAAKLKRISSPDFEGLDDALDGEWNDASPAVRQWLTDNQEALTLFRQASEMPHFLAFPPKNINCIDFALSVRDSRDLVRLTTLQAKRLIATDDFDAAWNCLGTQYRFSRQLGENGLPFDRTTGAAFFSGTVDLMIDWADRPNVTAEQLRQARLDIERLYRKSVPVSALVRVEYMAIDHLFDDPELLEAITVSRDEISPFSRQSLCIVSRVEPQFSQRLIRHVFRNWLPYVDLPKHSRPKTIGHDCPLFDVTPVASSAELSPREMLALVEQSVYAKHLLHKSAYSNGVSLANLIDQEQTRQNNLRVILAAQQYRRDHGKFPSVAEDLIAPGYLDKIPFDATQPTEVPIHYRNAGDEIAVYGLGEDGIDDGGLDADWNTAEGDYGYVLTVTADRPKSQKRSQKQSPKPGTPAQRLRHQP